MPAFDDAYSVACVVYLFVLAGAAWAYASSETSEVSAALTVSVLIFYYATTLVQIIKSGIDGLNERYARGAKRNLNVFADAAIFGSLVFAIAWIHRLRKSKNIEDVAVLALVCAFVGTGVSLLAHKTEARAAEQEEMPV
jgi:cytochrome bd-type quinol oxidase subunit 2